jgi:hypothetical protein
MFQVTQDRYERRAMVMRYRNLQVAYTLFNEDPLPTKQIDSYLVHSLRPSVLAA